MTAAGMAPTWPGRWPPQTTPETWWVWCPGPVTGVKVLGCDDSGYRSTVIEGIDWVTSIARKPAIANISFAGPASQALDCAVRRSRAAPATVESVLKSDSVGTGETSEDGRRIRLVYAGGY